MKNETLIARIQLLFTPVLIIVLGIVLFFRPDTFSALVAKTIGSLLVISGIFFGASAVFSKTNLLSKVVSCLACVIIGGWLLKNPLRLAAVFGQISGILIALRGVKDIRTASVAGHGTLFAVITIVVGILLLITPLSASRLVLGLCGVVVTLFGIFMLIDRLKYRDYLNGSGDIIDV